MNKSVRLHGLFPLLLLTWLLSTAPTTAATLDVSPAAISNQYVGVITLAITGLNNGETVNLDKYLDANANGVIDAGDLLEQRLQLTDNAVSKIGGATNVNIPGDFNTTDGSITTRLNFGRIDIDHIIGHYLFKLSSPASRFAPVLQNFNITNSAYSQSFAGKILINGTATPVPNAVVVILDTSNQGNNFIGGTVADSSGNYTFKTAPGTYQLVVSKSNFVSNFRAPAVTLTAGSTVTANVSAIPATKTISGRAADANSPVTPLAAFLLFMESDNGLTALSFTDLNGNFKAPVTSGIWKVSPQELDMSMHGYIKTQSSPQVDTTTGNVSGLNIAFPRGNAMFYGTIKDDLGNPMPGFAVYGNDQNAHQYETSGVSDADGNYAVLALAGTWSIGLSIEDPRLAKYVVSVNTGTIDLAPDQAVRQDFVFKQATNRISGYLRDASTGVGIANVGLPAGAYINDHVYTQYARTGPDGYFSLSVGNGTWSLSVNCHCDFGDCLTTAYQCPANQILTISDNDAVANFDAQPCVPLQITTTTLPDATVGTFYNLQIQAVGCNQPFGWSLSPGSATLPSDVTLDTSGRLLGMPQTSGTFTFSVRVTEPGQQSAVDQSLSLTVKPQNNILQITTDFLPDSTATAIYSATLNATGGQQPYQWSLTPGSAALPPLLNLSQDGTLSGTLTTAGSYLFIARVTDAQLNFVDRTLGLVVYPQPSLTALTRTGNQSQLQLTGTPGQYYAVEFSTNLANNQWFWLVTTNLPAPTLNIIDPNATNRSRFYRTKVGL